MLSASIAKALAEPCPAADAQAVLEAAEAEFRELGARADTLDVEALSPLLALPEALAKRAAAGDLRFEHDRMDASVSALRVRVDALEKAEAAAARGAERNAAIAERDELAAEIGERYPAIVRELSSLALRIEAADARCAAAGIPVSAEAIGRGVPANFHVQGVGNVGRIGGVILPMPRGVHPAWSAERIGGPIVYRGRDA